MKRKWILLLAALLAVMPCRAALAAPEIPDGLVVPYNTILWNTDEAGTHVFEFGETMKTYDFDFEASYCIGNTYYISGKSAGDGQWFIYDKETGETRFGTLPEHASPVRVVSMDSLILETFAENGDEPELSYYLLTSEGETVFLGPLPRFTVCYPEKSDPILLIYGNTGLTLMHPDGTSSSLTDNPFITESSLLAASRDVSLIIWREGNDTTHAIYAWYNGKKTRIAEYKTDPEKNQYAQARILEGGKRAVIWNTTDSRVFLFDAPSGNCTEATLPDRYTCFIQGLLLPATHYCSEEEPLTPFYFCGDDPDYFRYYLVQIDLNGNAEIVIEHMDDRYVYLSDEHMYYRYRDSLFRKRIDSPQAEPELLAENAYIWYALSPDNSAFYYTTDKNYEEDYETLNVLWTGEGTSEVIDTHFNTYDYYISMNGEMLAYRKDKVPVVDYNTAADLYVYKKGGEAELIDEGVIDLIGLYSNGTADSTFFPDDGFYYLTYDHVSRDDLLIVDLHYYDGSESTTIAEDLFFW